MIPAIWSKFGQISIASKNLTPVGLDEKKSVDQAKV